MIRIDYLMLGYRIFTVAEGDVSRVADLFLKKGISVRFRGNGFAVPEYKVRKIEAILSPSVSYTKTEIKGFYGFLYTRRKRYGAFFALVLYVEKKRYNLCKLNSN